MIGAVDEGKNTIGEAIAAAQAHLERGEPLSAYNEAQAGLAASPNHPRLRQLQALALARSGDTARANAMLQELAREGLEDAETLGMLARTHKDLALDAHGGAVDRAHLDAAHALYRRAHANAVAAGDADGAMYAGINAATLALVRGDIDGARNMAADVRAICAGGAAGYWREATLGEAALILGEHAASTAHYSQAAEQAKHRLGDKASTRRQLRVLLRHLPDAPRDVAKGLAVAPIVVFTGHMIDRVDRATPRFPASLESAVRGELRLRLSAIAPAAVYASAACGADLLCLEVARELGAETHIVLPFPPAEFRRVSVDFAGANWGERFDREIAGASSVTITSDHYARGSGATFEYANLILTGAARLRAQQLDASLVALAVSDAGAPLARGGTAWTLAQWKDAGIEVQRIALEKLRGPGSTRAAADSTPDEPPPKVRHELRAMLFADAVGYSKLGEDQIPNYIEGFLGAVGELSRTTKHPYEHVEVAGDGLYMVFRTVEDAGRFALQLSELANRFDRAAWSLPPQFNLRIALHCGPVHCARDPITGGPLYTGPHTSRTARIEPITPPGQVYASSAYASVAAALGADFALSYVGRMPLAKGYGTLGLYHLRGFAVGRSPM